MTTSFADYLYQRIAEGVAGFAKLEVGDIYAVSLWFSNEEDDSRRPTIVVGHNSETKVRQVMSAEGYTPDPGEARWNYAYWLQDMSAVVGDRDDVTGTALCREWIARAGLWYSDDAEATDLDATLDLGEEITERFLTECVSAARRLHEDGLIRKIFGRPIPVLVHDLEYTERVADWATSVNPPGVASGFVEWIDSMYR